MFNLLITAVFIALFGGVISYFYFATQATLNRKPGVPYFPGNWQSPTTILFRPEQLTEAGLRARRRCIASVIVVVLAWTLGIVLGIWWEHHNSEVPGTDTR